LLTKVATTDSHLFQVTKYWMLTVRYSSLSYPLYIPHDVSALYTTTDW